MIELLNCSKVYARPQGDLIALQDVTLNVERHEFVAMLGPSGCGKTTLLKIIAGLLPLSSGAVLVNGRPVQGPGPERAMVFQHYALLPWADVLTNIAFGLELRGMPRRQREARAAELAVAVGLGGFEHVYPAELSGGMQQRVGLARALAVEPEVLLLDEPFGALDAQTRRFMQEDLQRLLQNTPKTVLFVTHDIDEALRLADRVALFSPRPGRITETLSVPLARPRLGDELDHSPIFLELKEHLWQALRRMARPGLPATEEIE